MMKHAALLSLALCACTDNSGSGGGVQGTTHVATYELPAASPPKLDVLFVVDDTAAMATHQQALAAFPAELEQAFAEPLASVAQYHLGVITTENATLRRSSAVSDAFIVHNATYTGPANNYQGSLGSALASLWPSSAASNATSQPLAMAQTALANDATSTGFVRDDAYLAVVTITASDDASPSTPAEYATALKATKADPTSVVVSGVFDLSAQRLGAFHDQFPNRSDKTSIDETSYVGALDLFTQLFKITLGYNCSAPPVDLDPDAPGNQFDCSFVWVENGVEHVLPQCKGGDTSGCWEFVDGSGPGLCTDPVEHAHLQTRGFTASSSPFGDAYHPLVRGQCVVD